jgi:hypothetical protein
MFCAGVPLGTLAEGEEITEATIIALPRITAPIIIQERFSDIFNSFCLKWSENSLGRKPSTIRRTPTSDKSLYQVLLKESFPIHKFITPCV